MIKWHKALLTASTRFSQSILASDKVSRILLILSVTSLPENIYNKNDVHWRIHNTKQITE